MPLLAPSDPRPAPNHLIDLTKRQIELQGFKPFARAVNLQRGTIQRVLLGKPVSPQTIEKLSKIAPKIRTASEFQSLTSVAPPSKQQGPYSWSLALIRNARDSQTRGDFNLPVRLAEALRTDDALFTAYHNRIAPHNSVKTRWVPAPGARGAATARRAAVSVILSRPVFAGIAGTMANHGIAIAINQQIPNGSGTRVDFKPIEWPLEYVKWDASREVLVTSTLAGDYVDIIHGDGTWTVFRKFQEKPWTQEACVLPAGLLWAARAEGLKDCSNAVRAHGLAKVVGELPEGFAIYERDGGLTPEAEAFLKHLSDMVSGDAAAGIRPAGAKTDFISNGSSAWQIFFELITNRDKAAARIYLGTDATLGSVGGAPGVDIATLFGVATTKVQSDFQALEDGIRTGILEPWTAINDGDSRYAPRLEYQMPDPDADKKATERADCLDRLLATIAKLREQRFEVSQIMVDRLAADFGVQNPPTLMPETAATTSIALAPTDVARIVKVREARQSQGFNALGDPRDELMISELEKQAQAKLDVAVAAAPAPASP